MAKTFELKRELGTVYGIITVKGTSIWYNSREERDIAFLEMQG